MKMRLSALYAPPEHAGVTIRKTKTEAEERGH